MSVSIPASSTISRRSFFSTTAALAGAVAVSPLLTNTAFATAPASGNQVPGIYRLKVGSIEITALLDGHLGVKQDLIMGFNQQKAEAATRAAFRKNPYPGSEMAIPVNGYVINTGDKLIAVDVGTANLFGPNLGHFKSNLEQAGYKAEDIDIVYATHLHPDHVGGLIDANGNSVFPNAELITHEVEWNFWLDDSILSNAPDGMKPFFQMARNAVKPFEKSRTLVQNEQEIAPGIRVVGLPGHTPGHTGLHITSGKDELLIWGDVVHLTAFQFANPDWTIVFDVDQDLARKTRINILDRIATDRTPILGMHLDFPGVGHVARDGNAYKYHASSWQYQL